jgi:hypothetical protein
MELTGGWINEIKEVRKPIFDMLRGRVGRFPAMMDGGPTWFGVIADTQKPDEDHWLYRLAEEERPDGWEIFDQPGGVLQTRDGWIPNPDAENLINLPPNYYENQLAGATDDWIKVMLANEYGFVRQGKPVYSEYSDSVHCRRDLEPIPGLPIHVGCDFGLTPAAVIGQETASGQIRWLDELVTDDMGAYEFGEALTRKLNADPWREHEIATLTGDPAGNQKSPTDKETVFSVLNALGLPFQAATTNVFSMRREAVAVPLNRMIDGEPAFLISPKCKVTRKGMAGGYHYRRLRIAESEVYTDMPFKDMYSHPCEAGQYLNLGIGAGDYVVKPRGNTRARTANNPMQITEDPNDQSMQDSW